MECKEAVRYIHEYLDQDLCKQHQRHLRDHLSQCDDCRQRLQTLQHTVAFVRSSSYVYAPLNFTEEVLAALPKESYRHICKQKLGRHPYLLTALLVVLLLAIGSFSQWTGDYQFQLTSDQLNKLQIDEDTRKVIVPSNSVVNGNIVVRNADLNIEGYVQGDVTVVDGTIYLASTGTVTGERKEIHRALEWIWYQINQMAKQVIP